MLRRHPTRVEERADVADEYEAYLLSKETHASPENTNLQQPVSKVGEGDNEMAVRLELRRQQVRARIGLTSSK